jgi:hypothetical protein
VFPSTLVKLLTDCKNCNCLTHELLCFAGPVPKIRDCIKWLFAENGLWPNVAAHLAEWISDNRREALPDLVRCVWLESGFNGQPLDL